MALSPEEIRALDIPENEVEEVWGRYEFPNTPKVTKKVPVAKKTTSPTKDTKPIKQTISKPVGNIEDEYVVNKGDTMSSIAKRHGMSLNQLKKLNPQISDADSIFVGDRINLTSDELLNSLIPDAQPLNVREPIIPLKASAEPYKSLYLFDDKPIEPVYPEELVGNATLIKYLLKSPVKETIQQGSRRLAELNKANLGHAISGSHMTVNPTRLAAAKNPPKDYIPLRTAEEQLADDLSSVISRSNRKPNIDFNPDAVVRRGINRGAGQSRRAPDISNVSAKDYLGRKRELLDLERMLYGPK